VRVLVKLTEHQLCEWGELTGSDRAGIFVEFLRNTKTCYMKYSQEKKKKKKKKKRRRITDLSIFEEEVHEQEEGDEWGQHKIDNSADEETVSESWKQKEKCCSEKVISAKGSEQQWLTLEHKFP